MSLLRSVLKKNSAQSPSGSPTPFNPGGPSKPSLFSAKSSAASFKSVASTIQSIASFYSTITLGGTKVPKRRRPDISRIGVPEFYTSNPPPAQVVEGVELLSAEEIASLPFTAGHAVSLLDEKEKPWLSIVLFSHAKPSQKVPRYHNSAEVQGEVRVVFTKPETIESLDVWLLVKSESVIDLQGERLVNQHVNIWSRARGDPRFITVEKEKEGAPKGMFTGKFPAGKYVFPFSFTGFPSETQLCQNEELLRKGKGDVRLLFPPSYHVASMGGFVGKIEYKVGVDVKRGILGLDDELDMKLTYSPRARPISRPITLFPLLPTREDWPLSREVVGGWMLTPFGGRGRFRDEMIELEGILGIQSSPVYHSGHGSTVPFTLILHSTHAEALKVLGDPSSIKVTFERSEVFGPDALVPKSSSTARKNRNVTHLADGRVWKPVDSDDDASTDEFAESSEINEQPASPPSESQSLHSVSTVSDTMDLSSLDASLSEPSTAPTSNSDHGCGNDEDDKLGEGYSINAEAPPGLASPTPSLEDINGDMNFPGEEAESIVMLKGEAPVSRGSGIPSFKYKYMSVEYLIKIVIRHKDYNHITPSAPSIYCEAPIWVVSDPPRDEVSQSDSDSGISPPPPTSLEAKASQDVHDLEISGDIIPLTAETCFASTVQGQSTERVRPTWRAQRMAAF